MRVVAKLSAHRLVHKSDVGGVRVNLATAQAVGKAFDDLMNSARARGLIEQVDGVLIQPMIVGGTETIVGLVEDPLFGPLVGVGLGGVRGDQAASARSIRGLTALMSNGLSMMAKAPRRSASFSSSGVPKAVITMTGTSGES